MGIAEIIIILVIVIIFFVFYRRVTRPAPPLTEPQDFDPDAIADSLLQSEIAQGRKINAIKRYRELTGVGLKEAKDAVEWGLHLGIEGDEKKKRSAAESFSDAGIRDLLREDRFDEAVELYAKFAGVDEYTAREAVEDIAREARLESDDEVQRLDVDMFAILDLLRAGKKIEAIKRYQQSTGVGLKEAKDAVEALEWDV